MIPSSNISLIACIAEVGLSGAQDIATVCGELNVNSTGAVHSADSWYNMVGFTGDPIWHFLTVNSAQVYASYVRTYIYNNAIVDAQSGTLIWMIKDSMGNLLGYGNMATGSIPVLSSGYVDLPYSGGTPYTLEWEWYSAGTFQTQSL
jgi:hypothetical protein